MGKERIAYWDNMKFILMVLVVMGHGLSMYNADVFSAIYIFIYSFHMPLFIFISGLFHKNSDILNRAWRYVIIGYVLKIVIFLQEKYVLNHEVKFELFSEARIPWFILAIPIFAIITYFVKDLNKKTIFIISIIGACFAGYDNSINDFLVLSRIFVFYPFYLLGNMIDKDKIVNVTNNKPIKVFWGG